MADDQAWAIGAQIGSERARERRQRKADARQEKIKLRDQLATKISSLEEGTPEHKQAKDLLVQVDTDLMDPNHPMPIEKIKNLLTGHFGHKQPAQPAPSVTTQVGGVSTPDISSGPSIPSAEHLLSVPALGQTASTPTPITIPEPPTEAPAAPTEAAQPPARNYASPDNTSGVVDPRQFRPSTPMLRRAFPAKPGFHLVTNPMEGQKAYYQSDSDPNDIREAKTGLKKKVSVEDASATTPASQKAAPGAGSTPATSQSSYPTGKATPLSQTDKDAITQQFPAYAPYLDQVVIHPMEKGESPEDWSETYVPWESKNPAPGKLTMEPYAKTTPDEYRHMVTGEMLHYIGGVNPQTGQPINPEYQNLKQAVAAAAPPGLKKMDQDSYREAQRKGDKRSFEDWYNQSRLDETIMGYVNPDKQDNWRKAGVYNDPKMHQAVENLRQYLTGTSPNAAPAAVPKPGTGKPGSPLNPYSAAPYNNAGMEPPEEAYARNKQWAKAPGPNGYVTQLAQDQEARFQEWAHKPENWDYVQGDMGPTPGYDIRGWFQAMEAGDPRAKKDPKTHHFNDYWKTPYSGEGFGRESKYGTPDGPYWTGNDQVGWSSVTSDGRIVLAPWKPTQNPTEQSQAVSPTAQGQPAAPAATTDTGQLPALPTPAVSIPGHELTVKGPAQPKLSPRQQKAQSQAEQQAQLEIAAAGLTPEEKGIAQARADAAGNLFAFQANSKLYEMMNPRPTDPAEIPEWEKGKRAYQNELLQGMMGIKNKRNIKMFTVPGSTTPIPLDQNDPESWPEGAVPYKEPTIASIEIEEFRQAQNAGYTGTIMQYKADSVKSKAIQAEWTRAHYGGRDMDQLSPKEADQAMARFKEESTPDTTSNGQTLVFDQNMQPHVFTHTTTSHKSFSGAGGGPSAQPSPPSVTTSPNGAAAPNTLAGVKGKAAKLNPPTSSAPRTPKSPIGPPLDFKKMTPEITAANKLYNDAVGLVEYADKVQKHPNNAQEQRDFAIKMERVMSGRFQTAAYDLEVKNSGIANTFQQWVNDIKTGALPQQIVDHLVESAHDYKDSMAAEVAAAKGTSPDSSGGSSTPNAGDKSLADRLHQAYGAKK